MSYWADKVLHHKALKFFFGDIERPMITLSIGAAAFGLSALQSAAIGVTFGAAMFSLLILWYIRGDVMNFFRRRSGAVWGEAIVRLKDAYAAIHDFRKHRDSVGDKEMIDALTLLCDNLKIVFDRKTGADCGVSIKVPVKMVSDLKEMEVRNLCRDSQHHLMRDTTVYNGRRHLVSDNTAFIEVANNIVNGNLDLSYVNNDIPNTKGYQNTSIGCYGDSTLPYKSELVYPILPVRREGNNYPTFGFVCVDCAKTNGFDKGAYEIPMIQGVADGIYDIIEYRMNKNLKADDQRTEV